MNKQTQLEQFREQVYQSFPRSADALLELLDALCSQTNARSVAELSLEPPLRRTYNSLYRAIDAFFTASSPALTRLERRMHEREWLHLASDYVPEPERQAYWLFGTDTTSAPRRFARTLEDRGFVYQPNMLKGNKPVTIGHRYSVIAQLPEKAAGDPAWIVPLVTRRVTTQETEVTVGLEQLAMLMDEEDLPWSGALCVHVGDTRYSTPQYLAEAAVYENLVTIARLRSNRTLYRQPPAVEGQRPRGHPTWYGEPFKLGDPTTWHEPDEVVEVPHTSRRGRTYTVRIEAWHDMLMSGTQSAPMHRYPFTLLRIVRLDEEGQPTFKHPIWLVASGQRRCELAPTQTRQAYAQRYDLEHFFRFGKQRLLLTAYQTPDVRREENWWQLVQLAYLQLWLTRDLVETLPRPWERYLPRVKGRLVSPSAAQRGFRRIIRQFGTPAAPPKPRGYSPGRTRGVRLLPRERLEVVKKTA
jgi:hypothetical protein